MITFRNLVRFFYLNIMLAAVIAAQTLPVDNCSWRYEGESRAEMKNRLPPQRGYRVIDRGRPITVEGWYELVCPFGQLVPDKRDISDGEPIADIETIKVTLKGYLLTAKFERGEDHDIHAEIGLTKAWEGDHVIVELPAMPEYCTNRKKLWNLVREDRRKNGLTRETSEWIFKDPPQVLVTGYIFLDKHHWTNSVTRDELCHASGGRGAQENGLESQVRGLWEIHPVIGFDALTPVRRPRRR